MNRQLIGNQVRYAYLAVFALAAAGVSGRARAETLVDACSLLSQAQVTAALGVPVDAGVRPIATEPRMCNWRESNKPTGPGRNVMLTVITAPEYDSLKKMPLSAAASGVGDEAIVTHSMRVPVILTVKAGTHYFRILARSSLEASEAVDQRNQAIEKNLAALILKKL